MFRPLTANAASHTVSILAETKQTQQQVWAGAAFRGLTNTKNVSREGISALETEIFLQEDESIVISRVAALLAAKTDEEKRTLPDKITDMEQTLAAADYETLKAASAAWWAQQWKVSDIEIDGDEENQQGIRFCIFQLHQTLHTAKYGAVFGAKGLTGEAYNDNTFWDSEVCCLPFYLFNNPEAARSFLKFRFDTLPEAKERAAALDCKGAFYPIATISGRECCDLWQHASLQLQASTGVAYGLWNYVHQTGDRAFLYDCGAKMLAEICRMLASRGGWDPETGKYGYYCVMGPDEYHERVNNNAYTNKMAQKTMRWALEGAQLLRQYDASAYQSFDERTRAAAFLPKLAETADTIYVPQPDANGVIEQFDGYFALEDTTLDSVRARLKDPREYWGGAYGVASQTQIIKQADVMTMLELCHEDYSAAVIKANWDYYSPRTEHGSSLSACMYALTACRWGGAEEAYPFFMKSALADWNGGGKQWAGLAYIGGTHPAASGGAWKVFAQGFAGLEATENGPVLHPRLPRAWERLSFICCIRGKRYRITADHEKGTIEAI